MANVNFYLPVEEYLVRSQKVQRNVGVRHQKKKRQGILWLPVKLEDFSRSPSNSAARHNKADKTSARGV